MARRLIFRGFILFAPVAIATVTPERRREPDPPPVRLTGRGTMFARHHLVSHRHVLDLSCRRSVRVQSRVVCLLVSAATSIQRPPFLAPRRVAPISNVKEHGSTALRSRSLLLNAHKSLSENSCELAVATKTRSSTSVARNLIKIFTLLRLRESMGKLKGWSAPSRTWIAPFTFFRSLIIHGALRTGITTTSNRCRSPPELTRESLDFGEFTPPPARTVFILLWLDWQQLQSVNDHKPDRVRIRDLDDRVHILL